MGPPDLLQVAGPVDLSRGPVLNVLPDATPPAIGRSITILTCTGGITGAFRGLPNGTVWAAGAVRLRIKYTATSVLVTRLA